MSWPLPGGHRSRCLISIDYGRFFALLAYFRELRRLVRRNSSFSWTSTFLIFLFRSLTSSAAPLLNASSLSSSYKIPPASTTIAASTQNSSAQYVYGNCANDTALSTAYTTISSYNTVIVSTIAPSATCCTKCEIDADMVCFGIKGLPIPLRTFSFFMVVPWRRNGNESL